MLEDLRALGGSAPAAHPWSRTPREFRRRSCTRLAINGFFGRIGRCVVRAAFERGALDFGPATLEDPGLTAD
jgi:hypothetical protein